jgi:hypothetical protein
MLWNERGVDALHRSSQGTVRSGGWVLFHELQVSIDHLFDEFLWRRKRNE